MQHYKLRASQSPGQREPSAQLHGTILDAETYVDPRRVKRTGQRDPSYRAFFLGVLQVPTRRSRHLPTKTLIEAVIVVLELRWRGLGVLPLSCGNLRVCSDSPSRYKRLGL